MTSVTRAGRAYLPAVMSLASRGERFVIICPGRCGSELLVELLRGQPAVACDGEILTRRVRFPNAFMEARVQRARVAGAAVYGCKILVDQLDSVQGVPDPRAFFARLDDRGWSILGLTRRNVLRQSISWLWAARRGKYHARRGERDDSGLDKITVDTEELIVMMALHERANGIVDDVTSAARFSCKLVYEDDLECAADQQATIERVMRWVGHAYAPTSSDLVPTGAVRLRERVDNFDEVAAAVKGTKFAPLLEYEL